MKAQRRYCLVSSGRISRSKLCAWRKLGGPAQKAGTRALQHPSAHASGTAIHVKPRDNQWHRPISRLNIIWQIKPPLWTLVSLFVKGEKAGLVTFLLVLKQDCYIYDFSRMSPSCLQIKHKEEKLQWHFFFSHHLWLLVEAEANAFVMKCFLKIPTGLNVTGGATHGGDPPPPIPKVCWGCSESDLKNTRLWAYLIYTLK